MCLAMLPAWVALAAAPALALDPADILVIYNSASPEGAQVASYYAQIHPGVRILALSGVPVAETVQADTYLNAIRPQVLSALDSSIDCIVTTKGLPLRIDNPGYTYRYSSLESELTRIDTIASRSQMDNQWWYLASSPARNPYWGVSAPFDYNTYGMRLTSRLDGFTVEEIKASIDRAQRATVGQPWELFLLDDDPGAPAAAADRMPSLANSVLAPRGLPYAYDNSTAFVRAAADMVLGYVSHGVYSGAPENYLLDPSVGLTFPLADGAVFHTWESYNAYTFQGDGSSPKHQGLIAQWIRRGGTAAVGQVEEPGATSSTVTNEDRLFQMLLDGYTFAEAAWNSTRQLSYVNTVVGDPLMRFRWDTQFVASASFRYYQAVEQHFGMTSGATWAMGDYNGDGAVNFADYQIMEASSGQSIPEPGMLSLLAVGGVALVRRRRA